MDVEERVWEFVDMLLRDSEDAPEGDYRAGFQDALVIAKDWLEDNYEIEAAS